MNIQMFIRGWLVFEITGSYEKLGWMTAAGGLVGLIAAPLGGVVADRVKQKKVILQVSGVANALITFWIAALIYQGDLEFAFMRQFGGYWLYVGWPAIMSCLAFGMACKGPLADAMKALGLGAIIITASLRRFLNLFGG